MKKILLDENLPKRLFYRLLENGFDVHSVRSMEWLGLKNGKLLAEAIQQGFEVFLTSDKKMQFEQNVQKLPLAIVILDVKDLNYQQSILPILLQLLTVLPQVASNQFYVISQPQLD